MLECSNAQIMKNRIFVTNSAVLDQTLSEAKNILSKVSQIGMVPLEELKSVYSTLCKTKVRMEKVKVSLEVFFSLLREV